MSTIEYYGAVVDGSNAIKEKIEILQGEIFENMEIGPFKEYLLNELSKIEMKVLDTQQVFTEGYCLDSNERQFTSDKIQEKINSINDTIRKDGLSL